MGVHAAALEAACTAIPTWRLLWPLSGPAALDGGCVRARNQLEMAGSDLLSAQDATGKARRETDWPRPHLEMSA